MLYTRKVGRSTLGVREGTRSTLQHGRPRARSGYDAVYVVVAFATQGRDEVALGTFDSLRAATMYVDCYSPKFGLITRG